MPFNKGKLKNDFFAALGATIPKDDDKTKATVMKIAGQMANGIEQNPTAMVLKNEEHIELLQSQVVALEEQVSTMQTELDALEISVETLTTVVDTLKNPLGV
tara:strand:- start:228 stop:533 length:306 start_codon:yes stop_codon:yes gene_type:complete